MRKGTIEIAGVEKMIREMFSSDGSVSSMRVFTAVLVVTACFVAAWGIVTGRDLTGTAALVGAILVPALGGKAVQSFSENRGVPVPMTQETTLQGFKK